MGHIQMVWLPFGLKVAGDVFQERVDRVLRGIPNIHNIADNVLVEEKAEAPLDKSIITLLEIARARNITFNCDKFVFNSKDLKFLSGNLTPEEYKVDSKKLQAITEIKPSQNFEDLQSHLGLVNYPNPFIPKLAELTAPLKAVIKRDTV